MGSTFVTLDKLKSDIKSLFGSNRPHQVWLQFVPGIVTAVTTSEESGTFDGNMRKINSIIATSHYDKQLKRSGLSSERNRYYPLLRGIVDVPTVGDPVLLCTFAGIQYYFGPLNTENSPNFNVDNISLASKLRTFFNKNPDEREVIGLSKNFMRLSNLPRLQKKYIKSLDDPRDDKPVYKDIPGDLIYEGRHGNSIRIGSRDINPYIIISNGRGLTRTSESLLDGTIFAILENGSLNEHFSLSESVSYTMSSDRIKDPTILMSELVSIVNNNENSTDILYNYINSQSFLISDRITIDAKKDSMFITSFQNIHIGAGKNLTISANKDIIFESSNIYLGKAAKNEKDTDTEQGLLLGENLRALLEQLINILSNINGHCQGAPLPLGYNMGAPGSLAIELQKIKKALMKNANSIISTKHFIESEGKDYRAI